MKWRNWEVVLFWPPHSWWCVNWGLWPNEREPEYRFLNILFLQVRMFLPPKESVCNKCGQELP